MEFITVLERFYSVSVYAYYTQNTKVKTKVMNHWYSDGLCKGCIEYKYKIFSYLKVIFMEKSDAIGPCYVCTNDIMGERKHGKIISITFNFYDLYQLQRFNICCVWIVITSVTYCVKSVFNLTFHQLFMSFQPYSLMTLL